MNHNLFELLQYESIHQVRRAGKGSGIAVFLHKSLTFNIRHGLSVNYGAHSVLKPFKKFFLVYKKSFLKYLIHSLVNKKTIWNKIIHFCSTDKKDFIRQIYKMCLITLH